jgi:hypothetical protein
VFFDKYPGSEKIPGVMEPDIKKIEEEEEGKEEEEPGEVKQRIPKKPIP